MFHNIPQEIQKQMNFLYSIDLEDRTNGTPRKYLFKLDRRSYVYSHINTR